MRRSLCSFAHRRAAHRRRSHGPVQLAAGARHAAARSCCGSRIPTASARPRRTSSRSSTRCAGWSSTGTRGRSSRRSAPSATARRCAQLLDGGLAYRSTATADDVKAFKERHGAERGFRGEPEDDRRGAPARARRRARRSSTTSIRGETRFQHVAHGRPGDRPRRRLGALQLRGRDRRPRRRHHARRARRGPPLQHAQAAARVRGARRSRAPRYAHLPLLHGPDGKKLSKRHGAASVQELRDAGYLPEAVVNYIALLGAGFDAEEEYFPRDELAERFGWSASRSRPAVFDEQKLRHINGRYLRELPVDELTRAARGVHRAAAGCATASRSAARRSRRWPTSGRWPASSTTARSTTQAACEQDDRRARAGAEALAAARDGAGGARAVHAGGRRGRAARRSSRRAGGSRAGLPAAARRDRRHDDLAGDLRERRAAGPRGDAAPHRRGARSAPSRTLAPEPIGASGTADRRTTERPKPVGRAADRGSGPRHRRGSPLARRAEELYDRMTPATSTARRPRPPTQLACPSGPAADPPMVRHHNEGHGRRLTAAFEALEAFPVLAESRNRVLRLFAQERAATADVVDGRRVRRRARDRDAAAGQPRRRPHARPRRQRRARRRACSRPQTVQALASRARTFDFFERTGVWEGTPERFRLHGVATQRAADRLAAELGYEERDRLMVTSLLHDVGKLVLAHAYPGYPRQVHGDAQHAGGADPPRAARAGRRPRARRRRARAPLGPAEVDRLDDRAPPRRRRRRRGRARAAGRHARPLRAGRRRSRRARCCARARTVGLGPAELRAVMYDLPYPSNGSARASSTRARCRRARSRCCSASAEGKVYKQIAHELALSTSTVRTHLHNIYGKLGAVDRAQAVLIATERGWS